MKAHALRALYGERLLGRTVRDGEGSVGVVTFMEMEGIDDDGEISFVIDTVRISMLAVLDDEDVLIFPFHLLDRCVQARWATRVRR